MTFAQNEKADKAAYIQTITARASKIVDQLGIQNDQQKEKVRDLVRDQYSDLNDIYVSRDLQLKQIKSDETDKALRDTAVAKVNQETDEKLNVLHAGYLKKLNAHLSHQQVEGVKDGMTYGVLPLTYNAYQQQILTLTAAQKAQILAWLTEAREKAMDAESSEKKHAWFGKYKGRINNYLSAQGYDLKKEGAEWEKRRKEAASVHTNSTN